MIDDVTNSIFSGIPKSDVSNTPSDSSTNDSDNSEQETGISDDLAQEMRARYELLPEDLQNILTDSEYPTTLFNIAKENQITYEELASLEMETLMVFLGMNSPEKFRKDLKLVLDKRGDEIITKIANSVDEQLFGKVKESLNVLYEDDAQWETYTPEEKKDEVASTPTKININVQTPPAVTVAPASYPVRPAYTQAAPVYNPTPAPATQIPVQSNSPLIPTRAELLNGIENPVKTQATTPQTIADQATAASAVTPNIVASKLTMSSTPIPNKATDYTLPKTSQNGAGGSDPYREIPK